MDDKTVARGIAREKTAESIGVFQAIGAIIVSWILGSLTAPWIGVLVMVGLFGLILRRYSQGG